MSTFKITYHTPAVIEHIRSTLLWKVYDDFEISFSLPGRTPNQQLTVTKGYTTDLTSSPRFFWRILPPSECPEASLPHDFIYTHLTEEYTKAEADTLFWYIHIDCGTPRWKASGAYQAVKYGGKGNWKK